VRKAVKEAKLQQAGYAETSSFSAQRAYSPLTPGVLVPYESISLLSLARITMKELSSLQKSV
jgi:hypothetical protein